MISRAEVEALPVDLTVARLAQAMSWRSTKLAMTIGEGGRPVRTESSRPVATPRLSPFRAMSMAVRFNEWAEGSDLAHRIPNERA